MTSQDKKGKAPFRGTPKRGFTQPIGGGKPKGKNQPTRGKDESKDATSTTSSHQDEQSVMPTHKTPPASDKPSPQSQASNKSEPKSQASGKPSAKQRSPNKSTKFAEADMRAPTHVDPGSTHASRPLKKTQNVDEVKAHVHSDGPTSILSKNKTLNVDKDNAHVHSNSPNGSDLSSVDLSPEISTGNASPGLTLNDQTRAEEPTIGVQDTSIPSMIGSQTTLVNDTLSTSTPHKTSRPPGVLGSLLGTAAKASKSASKALGVTKSRLGPPFTPLIYGPLRSRSSSDDSAISLK